MFSLHYIGHMVGMVIIATLVHKILDLTVQVEDLKSVYSSQWNQFKVNEVKADSRKSKTTPPRDFNNDAEHVDAVKFDTVSGSIQSSAWCNNHDHHLCKLVNLCYHGNADEFVMFQDVDSVYENVEFTDGGFKLDLSSVSAHNVYQATVVNIPSKYSDQFNITWVNDTTLIFKPFLPDNIMHVFHDDILPLHHSMKYIYPDLCNNGIHHHSIQIFALDDLTESEMVELYEIVSDSAVKYKKDFTSQEGLTCFKEVYMGLAKTTVWYDFGFTKPQGPVDSLKVTGNHVHSAVKYIWNQLKLGSEVTESSGDYLVLFTRKENRKILNEVELTLEIVKQVGIKVININFETHSLSDMISTVRNSGGIIGMHGSMMILGIFLKPGSIFVELFPYAVNPVNYTPYKTLAELPGMNILYAHWANRNAENTVGHPDWREDVGGLNHLDAEERDVIMNQAEVPPHLCCSDPSWLYHIYQDTVVDVAAVTSLVKESIERSKNVIVKETTSHEVCKFHPSKVQKVKCSLSNQSDKLTNGKSKNYFLYLQWTVPWTIFLLRKESVHYEILIQDLNEDSKPVSFHKTSSTSLSLNVDKFGLYYVWVKSVVNEMYAGPYSDAVICEDGME